MSGISNRTSLLISILLVVLFAVSTVFGSSDEKISSTVFLNQYLKEFSHSRDREVQDRIYEKFGLNRQNPDSVSVVLYTTHELSAAEKREFQSQGIEVSDFYIPPVPNRHPNGFHLARMDFSAMNFVRSEPRILRVDSVELLAESQNDTGGEYLQFESVHTAANGIGPFKGSGVRIAVADSGFDITHPDFTTPMVTFDVFEGETPEEWSTDVRNRVSSHGTHVLGSVAGTGLLSDGRYAGGAPDADLLLYKIGGNESSSTTTEVMMRALQHAVTMNSDIFTMSYGGMGRFQDGSEPMEQLIDWAYEQGTLSFIAAGNNADKRRHHFIDFEQSNGIEEETAILDLTLNNQSFSEPWTIPLVIRILWRSDDPFSEIGLIEVANLGEDEEVVVFPVETSVRGTYGSFIVIQPNIEANSWKNYEIVVSNQSAGPTGPVRAHFYSWTAPQATFPRSSTISRYTVTHPALADRAIAVGAWTSRGEWTNYFGQNISVGQTTDTMALFSGRGPRIDGVMKPNIIAPGSSIFSTKDSDITPSSWQFISNDGRNNGTGPSDYFNNQGTSMACPLAAGATGLLIEASQRNFPLEVLKQALFETALDMGLPDSDQGHGMLQIESAITWLQAQSTPTPTMTPTPTTTPTPTPTPTPSPTPTPTPTPVPPMIFDFSPSEEGWQFLSPVEFSPSNGFWTNENLHIRTTDNRNSFAFWESPLMQPSGFIPPPLPFDDRNIAGSPPPVFYHTVWSIRTAETEALNSPVVRFRSNTEGFEQGDLLSATSVGEARFSPAVDGKTYHHFFTMPRFVNKNRLSFDVLNVDQNDDPEAEVLLQNVTTYQRFSNDLPDFRPEWSADFREGTHGWTFGYAPDAFGIPFALATDEGLSLFAGNFNDAPFRFGFWESPTGAEAPVTLEPGRLYHVQFLVTTNASPDNRTEIPVFRGRINDVSFQAGSLINIDSKSMLAPSPVEGQLAKFDLFFLAEEGLGDRMMISFDGLFDANANHDPNIRVTLRQVEVSSFHFPW